MANANKLKPLEIALKRLGDLSLNLVQDFAHMRQRGKEVIFFFFSKDRLEVNDPFLNGLSHLNECPFLSVF